MRRLIILCVMCLLLSGCTSKEKEYTSFQDKHSMDWSDYMERVRSEVETEKEVMNSVCDDWDNLMEIYSR